MFDPEILNRLQQKYASSIIETDDLSEEDIWTNHQASIWKAQRFVSTPQFYPVYHCGEFYSFSPLALILNKGYLALNQRYENALKSGEMKYKSTLETLDQDVLRIGGEPEFNDSICGKDAYIQAIADNIVKDIELIESKNPGYTNVLLCGGRDSMNMLLLPWNNPVAVYSAMPDYEYVQEFIKINKLPYTVNLLEDNSDPSFLTEEILENCCRNDLEHVRFGPHQAQIAAQHQHKAIFWLGHLGDVFQTTEWMYYTAGIGKVKKELYRAYRKNYKKLPHAWARKIEDRYIIKRFRQAVWDRAGFFQATHSSIIRATTGCLVLSAYQGPHMRKVFNSVDIAETVREDIRPLVGSKLAGREIQYLQKNPRLPKSTFRAGYSDVQTFLQLMQQSGFDIR